VGFVRLIPQRGAFVAELTSHDINEIFELREQLDGFAARCAATYLTDEEVAALATEVAEAQRLREAGETRAALERASETLMRITRTVDNLRLVRVLGQLEDESRRLDHLTFRSPGRLEAALHEHVNLIAALARRDPDAAGQAMRTHLRTDRDAAIGQLRGGRLA
jgi:GntR family transcriptional regulator, rspAB operon transcriptional repressor